MTSPTPLIEQVRQDEGMHKSKEWLEQRYHVDKMSISQIAGVSEVNTSTVLYWMDQHGIPRRDRHKAQREALKRSVDLSRQAFNFIDGGVMGDESIISRNKQGGYISWRGRHWVYAQWLRNRYSAYGLKVRQVRRVAAKACQRGDKVYQSKPTFGVQTQTYDVLRDIYLRWYPDGVKQLPSDIDLDNSLVWMRYFICDGSLVKISRKGWAVSFYPYSYREDEVRRMVLALEKQGLSPRVYESSRSESRHGDSLMIRLRTQDTLDFLNWVGPCPEYIRSAYGYKWRAIHGGIWERGLDF